MFSLSLNCLVDVNTHNELKTIGYYISFYGLLFTVGTLAFIVFVEFLFYASNKVIQHKEQLISYLKCSLLCFFLTIQPGVL